MKVEDLPETANRLISMRDGRKLGYAEAGDPHGVPVIHFHGWPGSRLEALPFGDEIGDMGVRVIGVDRPGMGLSDFQPGRRLLDWPDDVVQLADALGLRKFAVQGISGGGPYALACAYKIPERLTVCNVIAGMGPAKLSVREMNPRNRVIFFISKNLFFLLGPMLNSSFRSLKDTEKLRKFYETDKHFPAADKKVILEKSRWLELFVLESQEAFRNGTKGPAHEGKIYTAPWGFEPEQVLFDPVHIWQGEADVNVPASMARYMAQKIPHATLHIYPDEGHISVAFNKKKEIVDVIKQ